MKVSALKTATNAIVARSQAAHFDAFVALVSEAFGMVAIDSKTATDARNAMSRRMWDLHMTPQDRSRKLRAISGFLRLVAKKFPEHKRIVDAKAAETAEAFHAAIRGLLADHGVTSVNAAYAWCDSSDGAAVSKARADALRGERPDAPKADAPKADAPASGPPVNGADHETKTEAPPKSAKEREADALADALAAIRKCAKPATLAAIMRATQERMQEIAKAAPKAEAKAEALPLAA